MTDKKTQITEVKTVPFFDCLNWPGCTNPAAHGWATVIEQDLKSGRRRAVHFNQNHREECPWRPITLQELEDMEAEAKANERRTGYGHPDRAELHLIRVKLERDARREVAK